MDPKMDIKKNKFRLKKVQKMVHNLEQPSYYNNKHNKKTRKNTCLASFCEHESSPMTSHDATSSRPQTCSYLLYYTKYELRLTKRGHTYALCS